MLMSSSSSRIAELLGQSVEQPRTGLYHLINCFTPTNGLARGLWSSDSVLQSGPLLEYISGVLRRLTLNSWGGRRTPCAPLSSMYLFPLLTEQAISSHY